MNISEKDFQRLFANASATDQGGRDARLGRSELAAFLGVLQRRWRTAAVATGVVVVLAALYLLVATPQFTGTAALLIETNRTPPAPAEVDQDRPIDPAVIESQIATLTSEGIARAVIAKLDLTRDPEFTAPGLWRRFTRLFSSATASKSDLEDSAISRFERALKVTRIGRSYVAEVAFTSSAPQKAADIANAVAEAYIQDQLGAKLLGAQRAGSWMQERTEQLRLEADTASGAAKAFRDANAAALAAGDGPAMEQSRRLQASADAKQAAYEAIRTRSGRLRQFVQDQSFPFTQARLITEARPPTVPSSPKTALVLFLSALAGGLLGTGAAIARDWLDRRIRHADQLRDTVGVGRALGVPWPRQRPPSREVAWPALKGWQTDQGREAIRRIKMEIDRRLGPSPQGPVAIMSPRADDGRATLACGLAAALTAAGNRTLLIDADRRHAALTTTLAPESSVSLNALLESAPDGGAGIIQLKCGLDFIPATTDAIGICDLLVSPKMAGQVRQLVAIYDYILLDLPPMLECVDAAMVVAAVDGCILVAHAETSSIDDVVRAVDESRLLPQHMIAAVLLTSIAEPGRGLSTTGGRVRARS